jgi:hypothetical protein
MALVLVTRKQGNLNHAGAPSPAMPPCTNAHRMHAFAWALMSAHRLRLPIHRATTVSPDFDAIRLHAESTRRPGRLFQRLLKGLTPMQPARPNSDANLSMLPRELVDEVTSHLPKRDAIALSSTSRDFLQGFPQRNSMLISRKSETMAQRRSGTTNRLLRLPREDFEVMLARATEAQNLPSSLVGESSQLPTLDGLKGRPLYSALMSATSVVGRIGQNNRSCAPEDEMATFRSLLDQGGRLEHHEQYSNFIGNYSALRGE